MKFTFKWICTRCGHEHTWEWDREHYDNAKYGTYVNCDKCRHRVLATMIKEKGKD